MGALPDQPSRRHFLSLKPTTTKPSLQKYFANDPRVVPETMTPPLAGLSSFPQLKIRPALKRTNLLCFGAYCLGMLSFNSLMIV